MKVEHCKRCEKLYVKIKSPYCCDCMEIIEKQFVVIRDYIQMNPTADVSKIIEETSVEEQVLLYLLREERLSSCTKAELPCWNCGKLIKSGKYCPECVQKMTSDFSQLEMEMAQEVKKTNEMRNSKNIKNQNDDSGIHIQKK